MRLGFRCIEPNVEIFVYPGDLQFSLTTPEDRLRTPDGRGIVNHFLISICTTPGISIPYREIEYLLDQLDAIFLSDEHDNGLDQS